MYRINERILYRDYEQGQDQILLDLAGLACGENWQTEERILREKRNLYFSCIHRLVDLAGTYGFSGNLWHCYLTYLLVQHENVFSRACEIRGAVRGSINEIAEHDFVIFMELFDFEFEELERKLGSASGIGSASWRRGWRRLLL